MNPTHLIEVLEQGRRLSGKGICFINGSGGDEFLSYGELYEAALRTLGRLQASGMRPHQELVLQIEENKSFLIVFWACLLGGIIPVPLTVGKHDHHKQKVLEVWRVLNDPYMVISPAILSQMEKYASQKAGAETSMLEIAQRSIPEVELHGWRNPGQPVSVCPEDIAFIQFSSGSTGNAKGVMLTHRNLITNLSAISAAAAYTDTDSVLSWMPLTHDMGLIGFHLNPLFSGMNQFLMSSQLFVRRPALWLEKASEYKVSILSSPNFGYQYYLKHFHGTVYDGFDLSSVRLIYNGAEPISAKLCHTFLDRMAGYGLKRNALRPVYGLAEASLAVTISELNEEIIVATVDRRQVSPGDSIAIAGEGVSFVNVGRPVAGCGVRIVDGGDKDVAAGVIGYVQISGDNVTRGYYNNGAATEAARTEDGWMRTGDLGFLRNGELYITGRVKDIIFVNGMNYYPQDIESAADEVEGIELNKIAVCGAFNPEDQTEEIIAFVLYRADVAGFVPLADQLRSCINRRMGIDIRRIIPVRDMPRTTSGKLQRYRLLEQLRRGEFKEVEVTLERLMTGGKPAGPVEATENEEERRMKGVWETVLRVRQTGTGYNFFELGGGSLQAAELAMQIEKEFGVELTVETIYENPTVRGLTAAISVLKKKRYQPIGVHWDAGLYPVSAAQRRIYYYWQTNRKSTVYNLPVAFRLSGQIEPDRMEACITRMYARHDTMRMTFSLEGGEPMITVRDISRFELEIVECEEDLIESTLEGLVRPFDLEEGPLFRIKLIRCGRSGPVLFADFHHCISDGLSIYHFLEELLQLYDGREPPALAATYQDYVHWEQNRRVQRQQSRQEDYWRVQLQDGLPVLEMPCDLPRPAIFDPAGRRLELELGEEVTAQLIRMAAEERCTLHVLLFTIYSVVLYKYVGQQELVIGIPVSGRNHPDLQRLQGMYVNSLPVRTVLDPGLGFRELLAGTANVIAAVLKNQDYPFDSMVLLAQGKRDASRNALFDTMFIFQSMGVPAVEGTALSLSRMAFDPGFSKYDISLEVFVDAPVLRCSFEYATALFEEQTIRQLAGHFRRLVEGVISEPDTPLAELGMISREEHDGYVVQFNATSTPYPLETPVHRLFEQQAGRDPDKVAVICGDKRYSYGQLHRQSGWLCHLLKDNGCRPDEPIAVFLDRSPELVEVLLAVLKAGSCYVPIDTDLPHERVRYLLEDCGCRLVITVTNLEARLPRNVTTRLEVLCLDVLRPLPEGYEPPESACDGRRLAYIIYTSGTTGRPKGVMIRHSSLTNYACWAAETYLKRESLDFPLFTSVSFDLTVTSIFIPLITGGKIIIYKESGNDLPIERILIEDRVDVIKLTPSHLKLVDEIMERYPLAGSRIRRLIVGGEKLETKLAENIEERFHGKAEIYNEYGPTEATVGCMVYRFKRNSRSANVPIGIPASNTQIYLLDERLHPVPVGVRGHLFVSGEGVAVGYLHKEALTRDRFLDNPFRPGRKMYKTGDLARRLADGNIDYIGRNDQQIKLNGYRVEAAEIEHQLAEHSHVASAVVMVRKNKNGQESLYCYFVSKNAAGGPEPKEAALAAFLAARLPYYMIPARFIRLQEFPLTTNGKVDHDALSTQGPSMENHTDQAAMNATEAVSLGIWRRILKQPALEITDNFFEAGGDSIKAVQLSSALLDEGIVLPPRDILTFHTIRETCLRASVANIQPGYEQGPMEGAFEPLPAQRWFFAQRFHNPHFFNQTILLRLKRSMNKDLLERTFEILIGHYDELRVNYDPEKEVLFYNDRHLENRIRIERFRVCAENGLPGSIEGICRLVKSRFDIGHSLLLNAVLIDREEDAGFLLITAHHLVIDGVSWRILLEDLYKIYGALASDDTVRLPRKTASLLDWSSQLDRDARTRLYNPEKRADAPAAEDWFRIPLDFPVEDWRVEHQLSIWDVIDRQTTTLLLTRAHSIFGADAMALLCTALVLALREWTGHTVITIELEGHGRRPAGIDVSRTIGWFTIMYPVTFECKAGTPTSQVQAILEQLYGMRNEESGYDERPSPQANRNSLQEVRFNYLGQFDAELDNELYSYTMENTGYETDPANHMTAKLDLNLMILNGELQVEIGFNGQAHLKSTIERFKQMFFKYIRGLVGEMINADNGKLQHVDFEVDLDQEEWKALFG